MGLFPAQPPPNRLQISARSCEFHTNTDMRKKAIAAFLIRGRYLNKRFCSYNGLVNRCLTTIGLRIPAAYNVSVLTLCRHAAIGPTPSVSNEQTFRRPLAGAALAPSISSCLPRAEVLASVTEDINMSKPSDLVQGTLDMLLLKILALEPMN